MKKEHSWCQQECRLSFKKTQQNASNTMSIITKQLDDESFKSFCLNQSSLFLLSIKFFVVFYICHCELNRKIKNILLKCVKGKGFGYFNVSVRENGLIL